MPLQLCTPVFCRYRTRAQDCEYCKCKACDFCQPESSASPTATTPASSTSTAALPTPDPPTPIKPTTFKPRKQPASTATSSSSGSKRASLPIGSERLQVRLEPSLYTQSDLVSCGSNPSRCRAELYASELATALELPTGLLVVHDASPPDPTTATATHASDAGPDLGPIVLDLLPDPSQAFGDLGSLTPKAQLEKLKSLILKATHASSRSLRATVEILRLRESAGGVAISEPFLTEGEVNSARRMHLIPALIAMAIVGAGVLIASLAVCKLCTGFARGSGMEYNVYKETVGSPTRSRVGDDREDEEE